MPDWCRVGRSTCRPASNRARESHEPRRCARAGLNRPEARPSAQRVDAGDSRGIRRVRQFPGGQSSSPNARLVRASAASTSSRTSAAEVNTARSRTAPVTRRPSRTPGRTRSPWRSYWSPRDTPPRRGSPSKARARAASSSDERSRAAGTFLRSPLQVLAPSTCFASKRRRTACQYCRVRQCEDRRWLQGAPRDELLSSRAGWHPISRRTVTGRSKRSASRAMAIRQDGRAASSRDDKR